MKIRNYIILFFSLIFLFGCSPAAEQEYKKISIVCTNFPAYDFARSIAGDKAKIRLLVPPGTNIHSFEPKPTDILDIQKADIFIYNGGESDSWAKEILNSIKIDNLKVIAMQNLVKPVYTNHVNHEHHEHHHHLQDEHVWTSPVNASIISREIKDILVDIDNENTFFYENNYTHYSTLLTDLDIGFRKICKNAKVNTLVFADRFPFAYLANEYSLNYFSAFPGCSEIIEPTAKAVATLIDKVNELNVPVVFYVEFSNHLICDTLIGETNACARLMHSCHNLTKSEFESGISYIDIMKNNLKSLEEALL